MLRVASLVLVVVVGPASALADEQHDRDPDSLHPSAPHHTIYAEALDVFRKAGAKSRDFQASSSTK